MRVFPGRPLGHHRRMRAGTACEQQDGPVWQAVAEGVFAWVQPDGSSWVGHAGAIGTPDGAVLVDTCAINTHQHGDHAYGNSLLPGDLVARLPRQQVLFTGDLLFNRVTPLVLMGSADGAQRALDWIAGFGPEHVISGHGPVGSAAGLPDVLDTQRRYYQLVLDTAREGLRAGLPPLEAARRCELGPFAALSDAERIVLNLHRACADATGTEPDLVLASPTPSPTAAAPCTHPCTEPVKAVPIRCRCMTEASPISG